MEKSIVNLITLNLIFSFSYSFSAVNWEKIDEIGLEGITKIQKIKESEEITGDTNKLMKIIETCIAVTDKMDAELKQGCFVSDSITREFGKVCNKAFSRALLVVLENLAALKNIKH